MTDLKRLREHLKAHNQEHVLRFLGKLEGEARAGLVRQLASLDLELLDRLVSSLVECATAEAYDFEPAEVIRLPRTDAERDRRDGARTTGERLLREGIIVRALDGFGMPDHIRISIGLPEENERLVKTLRRLRENGL